MDKQKLINQINNNYIVLSIYRSYLDGSIFEMDLMSKDNRHISVFYDGGYTGINNDDYLIFDHITIKWLYNNYDEIIKELKQAKDFTLSDTYLKDLESYKDAEKHDKILFQEAVLQ